MENVQDFQDLGDSTVTIRKWDEVKSSGVESLVPDEKGSHLDVLRDIRDVIDEHYAEHIDDLAGDGEEVIIERAVFRSDDVPHIEYRVVGERE